MDVPSPLAGGGRGQAQGRRQGLRGRRCSACSRARAPPPDAAGVPQRPATPSAPARHRHDTDTAAAAGAPAAPRPGPPPARPISMPRCSCWAPAPAATARPSARPISARRWCWSSAAPALGGVCLNVGCIPSKALLHAAKVIAETKEMGAHGLAFAAPEIDARQAARLEGRRGQAPDRRPRRAWRSSAR